MKCNINVDEEATFAQCFTAIGILVGVVLALLAAPYAGPVLAILFILSEAVIGWNIWMSISNMKRQTDKAVFLLEVCLNSEKATRGKQNGRNYKNK